MRFDDSLKTVLAADVSTSFGARAAFRQLVDLIGRGRAPAEAELLDRVRTLASSVPVAVRAASARGLALADPPAALIAIFAQDEPEVASAVLRAARLEPEDWEALLPRLSPHGRSVLRTRRDLPPIVVRALESFGSTDFALSHDAPPTTAEPAAPAPPPASVIEAPLRAIEAAIPVAEDMPPPAAPRFEIADLVNRIEAFQRDRAAAPDLAPAPAPAAVIAFRFETDVAGTIRWVDTGPRGAVIGLSLNHDGAAPSPSVDGVAAGAFRKRAGFADARLQVGGESALAGDWRISGVPVFDSATGSFLGFRGRARRPRVEETAARPPRADAPTGAEGLRRLVHELRTPTNAIAGFSELIEQELLGPVAPAYRDRAATIRRHVSDLIGAIEDLDLAARIEGDALDLRPGRVMVSSLLSRVAHDLAPLAGMRGGGLALPPASDAAWASDPHASERLVSRLLATVLAAVAPGEMLDVRVEPAGDMLALSVARPAALAGRDETTLLALDDEDAGEDEGTPLLGAGFALRLARNLAVELGGRLAFAADRLTLTLPAALNVGMGQASTFAP
ncbi:HAMP domain-containing sensor histidine kinase [Sphingomonas adhaesiva]|uniref:HAMP domain-containing sensor histidine kinase n=1 Tax=Sphingomonas adhaesiva TaxID=28212 RepID=UPI002FFC05C9